jgi:hypothetical protein
MRKHWTTKLGPLILAATVVFTGCATIRPSPACDTEPLRADGAIEYTYADPRNYTCEYVGGAKEYSEYQRLATELGIAPEGLGAAEDASEIGNHWRGSWTPWWSCRLGPLC